MEDDSLTAHPDEISLLAPAIPEAFPGASFLYESASDAFRFSPVAARWFGTSDTPAPCAQSRVDFSLLKAHESEALTRSQLPWVIASTGKHCDPQEFTLRVPGQTPRHVLCCASPYTPVGGVVIATLAHLLRRGLRTTDIVGRYGGEEYMVVLPDTDEHNAKRKLDQLREEFGKVVFRHKDKEFHCSFSAGVCNSLIVDNVDRCIEAADLSLYAAKEAGRNQVHLATRS